jgi:phage repressor protein C with HTH and peptisase S24 domain
LHPRRKKAGNFKAIVKVKARLCAGSGSFETDGEIDDYLMFPSEWLARKGTADKMVLMDIFGNSMEPEIKNGDTILIDQSQREILAGAVYAIGIEDTIMVKRIERRPKSLVLLSENPNYLPIFLKGREMNSIRIIGRVIWISRELI